jgi:hypothetical protein
LKCILRLDRLPTPAEAKAIRDAIGIRRRHINAISGITVRRTSQAFFDSIDPEQTWVECYSNTSSAR